MNSMKIWLSTALVALMLTACEKEHGLDNDYFVFTNYDNRTDFETFETYFIPDSILIIGEKDEPEYLKGKKAKSIIDAYADNLTRRGYIRTEEKGKADLGLQISYVKNSRHFVGYTETPYWWWGYSGYWSPFYWGNWGGWGYSYPVHYSYSTESVLTELVDLKATKGETAKLPVVWNTYISGLLFGNPEFNMQLTIRGINQAFAQSEYIQK